MYVFWDYELLRTFVEIFVYVVLDFRSHYQWLTYKQGITFQYEFPQAEIDAVNALARDTFPERFFFGAAIAPYRTEDQWRTTALMVSSWKDVTDQNPPLSCDSTAKSCDLYPEHAEDISLAKFLGAGMLKVSLCWSKIRPNGYAGPVLEDSLDHYSKVIDEMLANGITPMVTIFDGNTPQIMQELGGWANPSMVRWFKQYARVAFVAFGDKVKHWVTMENPVSLCTREYGGRSSSSTNMSGLADYMCGRHVLLAHAAAYREYQKYFRPKQKGKVGIVQNYWWFESENPDSVDDTAAVETGFLWYNGWITNPVFGERGDYPKLMRERIAFKSRIQEFPESRLPPFTETEIAEVKGAADFLGVSLRAVQRVHGFPISLNTEFSFDLDADLRIVPQEESSKETWTKNTALALGKLLRRLNRDYVIPEIYVTGNGYTDDGEIEDVGRSIYYREHIREVLNAMQAGVNVRGFLACCLLDSFDCAHGVSAVGLFYTDFNGTHPTRRPKFSSTILSNIYKTKTVRIMNDSETPHST